MFAGALAVALSLAACVGVGGDGRVPPSPPDFPRGVGLPADLTFWDLWPELTQLPEDAPIETDAEYTVRRWPLVPFTPEQNERLVTAQDHYVHDEDEKLAVVRDELGSDPLAATWLARFFWLQIDIVRRSTDKLVIGPDGQVTEPYFRPRSHLLAMGDAAVPSIILDSFRRGDPLAVDLLRRLGPSHVGAWAKALRLRDLRARRTLYAVLADIAATAAEGDVDSDVVESLVSHLADGLVDEDFGVRSEAFRAVAALASIRSEDELRAFVIRALATEEDPYVRRKVVEESGRHAPYRDVVLAMIDAWERFEQEGDDKGSAVARDALRELAGRDFGASPRPWRDYALALPARPADGDGEQER